MCPVYNSTRNVELEVVWPLMFRVLYIQDTASVVTCTDVERVWPLMFRVLYIQDTATVVTCRKGMAIDVLCPMI